MRVTHLYSGKVQIQISLLLCAGPDSSHGGVEEAYQQDCSQL